MSYFVAPDTGASATRSSARAAGASWPRSTACRSWPRFRSIRRRASGGDEGMPITRAPPGLGARPGPSASSRRRASRGSTTLAALARCRRSADAAEAMAAPALTLPIFPLPDVTFFPHTLLPLHVFEARYRAMVTDALARDRKLAVVRLKPGYEASYAGKPPVYAVAGAGEIVSLRAAGDGPLQHPAPGRLARAHRAARCRATRSTASVTAQPLDDIEPTTDAVAGARAHPRAVRAPARGAGSAGRAARRRAGRGTSGPARSPTGSPRPCSPTPDLRQSCSRRSTSRAVDRVGGGRRGARERARAGTRLMRRRPGAGRAAAGRSSCWRRWRRRRQLGVARRADPRPVRAGDGRDLASATASARASAC